MNPAYDVAVVGAGVFGAWAAYHLIRSGRSVVLLDGYGAGNSRASSGGESRLIRMGYGPDEIYTRLSLRSLASWKRFIGEADCGQPLFHETGVLWLAHDGDSYSEHTTTTLERVGVRFEKLDRSDLEARYPQIALGPISWAILEPESGVLMARRAVQTVVHEAVKRGATYLVRRVERPSSSGSTLRSIETAAGERISAGSFVFACGPWLPRVFPDLLGDRIHPTRQDVLFFGVPAGDRRFAPPAMPAWVDFRDEVYGVPDLEGRGFKVGLDRHGEPFDPDLGERLVRPESIRLVRERLARRFPALAQAPIIESRVCQYENTSSGDLLIDRHPELSNVWIVGGGSGHGFKHGPAVGEYVAACLDGRVVAELRFALASKETVRKRAVY